MTGLAESLLGGTPLLEGEDPHAHLRADPSLKPPSGPSGRYYSWPKLMAAHRANYFHDETEASKFASSRDTPAKHLGIPQGSWRIDDGHKGAYGRDIEELQAHKPRDITPHVGEMTWEKGLRERVRHPDIKRYADWLEKDHDEREARGEKSDVARIPPLDVTKHDKGHLRISDGHRRLAAVDTVNQRREAKGKSPLRVPGWTGWAARHPEGLKDSEGREMKVGLTHEISQKNPEIDRTHSPLKEDTDLTEIRDTCLDCVRKHLSQALILMQEVHQGYPHHKWIAIGHMGEAADECCKDHPELADEIRKHRLKYMGDSDYQVPILDLIKKASKAAGDLSEERAERCGSVAASLLKPGTKRYEKWLSLRNYRRKATMKKKNQQEAKMADREEMLEDWQERRELLENGQKILFWSDEHRPEDYENCVLSVSEEKVTRVVEALQSGRNLAQYKGWAECRICEENLGTCDMGGHGFVWPQLAEHYVMEHGVWTPDLDALSGSLLAEAVEAEEEDLNEEREANQDNTTACGVFLPLPYSLAKDFPNKRQDDDSVPHYTLLYAGDLCPKRYRIFVKLVRKFAEKMKPFECDTYAYSEFLNGEGQKIPHMRPSAACTTKLAYLHAALRRFFEVFGKEVGPLSHSYGHPGGASPMVPYEIQFKPHATLAYLPPMIPYKGPKPTGSWRVNELECWGHERISVALGKTRADQPIGLTRDPLAIKYPMAVADAVAEDKIPGGLADKSKPEEFDPEQLRMGVKVEREHTNDPGVAKEIAMDHLAEDPNYYTKLKKIEPHHEDVIGGSMGAVGKGLGGSHGDIGLEGSLPYLEVMKKLERKKLAGLKK